MLCWGAVAPARRDRALLLVAAFVRATATGLVGVLLGLYVARLGAAASVGLVVGAGLAGTALAALAATLLAERRRRLALALVSLVGAAGALAAAQAQSALAIGLGAFVGMLNGMGRDRGAALIVELSVLPSTTTPQSRTRVFALYNVLQDAGHALGALAATLPSAAARIGVSELGAHRGLLVAYAAAAIGCAGLYAALSPAVEAAPVDARVRVSPRTRALLVRISALFAVDSVAGGFLTTALLSFFFFERFGVSEAAIGLLFFGARAANAASHFAAAWLAKRIGLVNTMVFTHMPSSLLLVTVAFAPTFPVAAALFLLREGLVEMDVPTRQSYVAAVVEPHERTLAAGVTQLVRLGGWAIAPFVAAPMMRGRSLWLPLLVGAAMKIAYDILLYRAFRGIKPPEEIR